MKLFSNRWLIAIFALAAVAYLIGLFIDILEVDACQYANISMEMLHNQNFLQVYHRGTDYLDKPPLLFWLSSFSYYLFGISNFSFRLPSFLFTLLGFYSTYRLAGSLYNKKVGIISVLLLATSQAYFLFNHDVRTDTILTGSVIFALWQLSEFLNRNKFINLLLGFVGIGLAMLAKGPIGIMVPIFAFAPDFIYRRKWKSFLKWEWLAGIAVLLVMLLPMSIGLYQQYGVYGLRFYFWIQSFGRITGENVWNNDPDPFFLYHSFLWAFLPWSLLAVYAVFDRIKTIVVEIKNKLPRTEIFTICGIILAFASLSRSHYQLPHYIFVLFPLFAVITAGTIEKMLVSRPKALKLFINAQLVVFCGLGLFSLYLFGILFPGLHPGIWAVWAILFTIALVVFFKSKLDISRLIVPSALTIIAINIVLNSYLYPYLLTFQGGTTAAKLIKDKNIPVSHIYFYDYSDLSVELYSHKNFSSLDQKMIGDSVASRKNVWLYTDEKGYSKLLSSMKPVHIYAFDDFPVSTLTTEFINPKTRKSTLSKLYLIEM
jgi:4-amino-4-deoxy-L-arabinose transferase-like glycosyltransferase